MAQVLLRNHKSSLRLIFDYGGYFEHGGFLNTD